MFFRNTNRQQHDELQEKILQQKVTLEQRKVALQQSIQTLQQEQTSEMTKAVEHFQFALDFDRMGAFSVERIVRDGTPRTIIGYFIVHPNGAKEVKEWVLYSSAKEHNRIVAEFEIWKGSRK
jgi:hypothetical protein